jgi:proteasome lid subunit RPN8/RPN11
MLLIDDVSAARMKALAEAGYPHEVCGLLVGAFEEGMRKVREVHPAQNLNRARAADRYDLSPADYARIERAAAARGLAVVGTYHSHPDHPTNPAETDRARAAEIWGPSESWSYVILEVAQGKVASWRSWVLKDEAFDEEAIRMGQGAG